MVWIVRIIFLLIAFSIFDIMADRIDKEKERKISWFGFFCFIIGQIYELIPWESFFK